MHCVLRNHAALAKEYSSLPTRASTAAGFAARAAACEETAGMLAAYCATKVGDIMQRVPCPGFPGAGKWFMLYLKSPLSKAIQERSAACSAAVGMLYWVKLLMMGPTASLAVAHSAGKAAPVQELEVGAMAINWVVGSERPRKPDGRAVVMERRERTVVVRRSIVVQVYLKLVDFVIWYETRDLGIVKYGFASRFDSMRWNQNLEVFS